MHTLKKDSSMTIYCHTLKVMVTYEGQYRLLLKRTEI